MVVLGENDRYALRFNPGNTEVISSVPKTEVNRNELINKANRNEPITIPDSDPEEDFVTVAKRPAAKQTPLRRHRWPGSQALRSEASVPKTLDPQAETPLSQGVRDHITDPECAGTAMDTSSPDTTDAKPESAGVTLVQQQPLVQEDMQSGPQFCMQDHDIAATEATKRGCTTQKGIVVLAGLCQYFHWGPAAQLGAMAAFMQYRQTCQQVTQVLLETCPQ